MGITIEQRIFRALTIPRTRREFLELTANLGLAAAGMAATDGLVFLSPKIDQVKKDLEGQKPSTERLRAANQVIFTEENFPGSYNSQTLQGAKEVRKEQASYEREENRLYEERGINRRSKINTIAIFAGLGITFVSRALHCPKLAK